MVSEHRVEAERWFFFQAEDGIRDLVRSRGLGDVYKRQTPQVLDAEVRVQGCGQLRVTVPHQVLGLREADALSLIHI